MSANDAERALLAAARAALKAGGERIARFPFAGGHCIAKAPGALRGRAQSLLIKAFCRTVLGCSVPLAVLRLRRGDERLAREAERLRALAAAGEAVPRLLAFATDCMVLEYVGTTLEETLSAYPCEEYAAFLAPAIDDLARFHAAGHWHGGSQLKNLTLHDGRIHRIDFEEDLGGHLPLHVAQAYDLILLANSATLLHHCDERTSIDLAAGLFARYLRLRPDPAIRSVLQRVRPVLSRLCRLLMPLRDKRGRSLKRIFILDEALQSALRG